MRNLAQTGIIAVVLLLSAAAGGCVVSDGDGVRPHRLGTVAHKHRVKKHASVTYLAKSKAAVAPGDALRKFCDQRHIQFQSGKLDESTDEMIRNNDLCKQIYETGSADLPAGPTVAAAAGRGK